MLENQQDPKKVARRHLLLAIVGGFLAGFGFIWIGMISLLLVVEVGDPSKTTKVNTTEFLGSPAGVFTILAVGFVVSGVILMWRSLLHHGDALDRMVVPTYEKY